MPRPLVHFIFNLERLPRRYACSKSPLQILFFVLLFLPSKGRGRKRKKNYFFKLSKSRTNAWLGTESQVHL
jgi:hypothetical protein